MLHLAMRLMPCFWQAALKIEDNDPVQIHIDNPDDERLAPYRDIRERDLVKNKRHFIAEGKTVLQVLAAQSRFNLNSLLILENRLAGLADVIQQVPDETPIYVVSQNVIDSVAGFPMHRGILAIGEAPVQIQQLPENIRDWKRVVVLAGLSNHDNVGSIFRNAAAFDVDAILIDQQTCDPLYRKSIRVSVGGVFKVPYFQFETLSAVTDFLKMNDFEAIALSPNGHISLNNWKPQQRSAVILGTEGEGLPKTTLNSLKALKVEMSDDFDSLNVATTSGIVLHHMAINQIS